MKGWFVIDIKPNPFDPYKWMQMYTKSINGVSALSKWLDSEPPQSHWLQLALMQPSVDLLLATTGQRPVSGSCVGNQTDRGRLDTCHGDTWRGGDSSSQVLQSKLPSNEPKLKQISFVSIKKPLWDINCIVVLMGGYLHIEWFTRLRTIVSNCLVK